MSLIPRGHFFETDRFFNDFFAPLPRANGTANTFFAPRVDIKDKEDHYEITAELPGVKKEDINVRLSDGVLTLEAELRREDSEESDGKVLRQERCYGKLKRSFNLGDDVHEEDISASFIDGVLALKAPKLRELPPKERQISIQ